MIINEGDKIRMTRRGKVASPLVIEGTVCDVSTNSAMAGTYYILLDGATEVFRSEDWMIEVLDREYPDGLYVIENSEPDEELVNYFVLQRKSGEWRSLPQQGEISAGHKIFLENVRAGRHTMVRLVKEVN